MDDLDKAARIVVRRFGFQVGNSMLRAGALAAISDDYPSEVGRIRAQQFWRDEVLKEYRALRNG